MTNPIIPVPVLSAAGWVRSASEKADALMAHFYESMKSQTALYGDNVSNLQHVVERYGNDPVQLSQQLRVAIERYLQRYYTQASVDISVPNLIGTMGSDKYDLRFYASVTEADGATYSFGRLLQISSSKLEKVLKLNELGENRS